MVHINNRYQRGFTLLEIMLVIVLIGITGTLVMSYGPRAQNPLDTSTTTLMVTLQNGLEQATQQEVLYGLKLAREGWQLMRYHREAPHWRVSQSSPVVIPQDMTLDLQIEQHATSLENTLTSDTEPQIWLFPGGETTVFSLSLRQGSCTQRITASGFMSFQRETVYCDGD